MDDLGKVINLKGEEYRLTGVEKELSGWETIGRIGYLGSKRDDKRKEYDQEYGKGNWRVVWKINDVYVGESGAYALYEDAYFEFLKKNPDVLKQIISSALDVYDNSPSNVNCGLDYAIQETNRTHLQDIAIRRSLIRLGTWFQGDKLIQIRDKDGVHPLSMILSPGRVPFHRPELIEKPELNGWWEKSSVESFYQSNRLLQKRKL